ncbi:MAG: asparaginase [Actinomycetes bacterium]
MTLSPLHQSRSQGEVLAQLSRDGLVESIHAGHLVALNSDGTILKAKGAIELPIYGRSALKALQAAGVLRTGLKVNSKQLALMCASHAGSVEHLTVVETILSDSGLTIDQLRNAVDKPLGDEERKAWGELAPTRLTQNCSGKHAGMLAGAAFKGWDLESYLSPSHPLQQLILQEIEALAGERVSVVTADGCGAPLFALSTLGIAKAFRALTISTDPIHQEIIAACQAHPHLVAGNGRLATRMMRAIPGLFMKEGAEAVLVATLPDGRTLVIKVVDGGLRALGPIIQAALALWGITTPDETVSVLGGDRVVGTMEALL